MNVYDDLLEQYNNLDEDEKGAILIYKTKLFNIINSVTKIDNYRELDSREILNRLDNITELEIILSDYRKVLELPENMFIKFTIFNNVNLNSLEEFIDCVKKIADLMTKAFSKIKLKDDLIVYRGLTSNNNYIDLYESSSIISTSLKLDDAYNFINSKGGGVQSFIYLEFKTRYECFSITL